MKNKFKKIFHKLPLVICIVFILMNIICIVGNTAYADIDVKKLEGAAEGVVGGLGLEAPWALIVFSTGTFALALLYGAKLLIIVAGLVIHGLVGGFFTLADQGIKVYAGFPEIVFAGTENGSAFLDVNFFSFDASKLTDTAIDLHSAVAKWYYIMRLISATILLVILIYVGIRMAISSVAEERAKYKKMLTDWATSLALLFLLQYIMLLVIKINTTLVKAFAKVYTFDKNTNFFFNTTMVGSAALPTLTSLFPCLFYTYFSAKCFGFLLFYLKRLITVGFLIIISPLITITYSIDKMGDGKSQALNAWLKEFCYNVLIQPFHCVIYICFFSIAENIIKTNANAFFIFPYVLAVVILNFMPKAEMILRKIFNFQANSMSSLGEAGKAIMTGTGQFTKMGLAAGTAAIKFKNSGGFDKFKRLKENAAFSKENRQLKKKLAEDIKEGKVDKKMSLKEYKKTDIGQQALTDIRAEKVTELKKKQDEKRKNKLRKAYDEKNHEGSYDELVKKSQKTGSTGKPTREALDAQKELAEFEQEQKEEQIKKAFKKNNKNLDYDTYKKKAEEKDNSGNPTEDAQDAQRLLKEAEDSLQKKRKIKKADGKAKGADGNGSKKGTKYHRSLMSDPTNRKMVQDTAKVVAGLIGAVTTRKRIKFTECNDRISSIFRFC